MLTTHILSVVTLSISSAELLPRVGDQISSLLGLRIGGGGASGLKLGDQISGLLIPRAEGSNQWPSGPKSWGAFGPKNQGIKSADSRVSQWTSDPKRKGPVLSATPCTHCSC